MTTDFADIGTLKLFLQRGLLGKVTANLAAAFGQLDDRRIIVSTYFFEEATEDDREYIEVAATEVVASFPAGYTIETRYGLLRDMKLDSTLNCVLLRAEAEARVLDRRAMQDGRSPKDGNEDSI